MRRGTSTAESHRNKSTHQRNCEPILRLAGYRYLRASGAHNIYVNDEGQRVTVTSSPRNEGTALRQVRAEIKRNDRERQANPVPTVTTQNKVDLLIAGADPKLFKTPPDRNGRRVRQQILNGWLKRTLQHYGEQYASDVEEAVRRFGLSKSNLQQARHDIGVIAYREKGEAAGHGKARWLMNLPEQTDRQGRVEKRNANGIQVIAPDPTPAAPAPEPTPIPTVVEFQPNGNSDLSAAAQMMLDALGVKAPGSEVRDALKKAEAELHQAIGALENATNAIAAAYRAL